MGRHDATRAGGRPRARAATALRPIGAEHTAPGRARSLRARGTTAPRPIVVPRGFAVVRDGAAVRAQVHGLDGAPIGEAHTFESGLSVRAAAAIGGDVALVYARAFPAGLALPHSELRARIVEVPGAGAGPPH